MVVNIDMKKNLVSVIMTNYNYSKYLNSSISSVLNQTYKTLELIIVDDASSDNSIDVINGFNDPRIKLIKNKNNKGVSFSRNIGIKKASGEYIAFIDSDDKWSLNKLEDQLNIMKLNNYAFTYTDFYYVKGKEKKHVFVPYKISYEENLWNTIIQTSTVMFNMNIIKKKDLYFKDIKMGEDVLCFWNILKKYGNAYGINGDYAYISKHKNSLSTNYLNSIIGVFVLYKNLDLPLFKRISLYIKHYMKAISKRYSFHISHIILVILLLFGLCIPKIISYKTPVQVELEKKIDNVLSNDYEINAIGFYNSLGENESNEVQFRINKIGNDYKLVNYSCDECFIAEKDIINYYKELELELRNVKQVSYKDIYHVYYSSIFTDKLFKVLRKVNNASSEAYIDFDNNNLFMNVKYYLLDFNISIIEMSDDKNE